MLIRQLLDKFNFLQVCRDENRVKEIWVVWCIEMVLGWIKGYLACVRLTPFWFLAAHTVSQIEQGWLLSAELGESTNLVTQSDLSHQKTWLIKPRFLSLRRERKLVYMLSMHEALFCVPVECMTSLELFEYFWGEIKNKNFWKIRSHIFFHF